MPADDVQGDQPSGSPDDAARAMIGRVVGDFEIRREIGRGGMGTVYEAWQRSLDRVVAVKVLSAPIGLSRTAIERFRREAQAAAKLHHANIVRVYAQGEAEGVYYYAMELVEGRSVYEVIEEARRQQAPDELGVTETRVAGGPAQYLTDSESAGRAAEPIAAAGRSGSGLSLGSSGRALLSATALRDFDIIARLTATVAEALEYAHQAGVIHRDVKPHNLILGNDGRLCISDFGLARVREQPGVTVTGEFLGSPLYMSPEQVSGAGARVDHRTDIYSLGVTLYEWLTLRPPFPGQRRDQVINQIMTAEPVSPHTLNTSIPIDLDTICLKAIERDPNRRYQTAGQMANDLHLYLERSGIKARRAGPLRRIGKFVYRRRVGALAAALVLVVAASATLLYLWTGHGPPAVAPEGSRTAAGPDRDTQTLPSAADSLGDVVLTPGSPRPTGSELVAADPGSAVSFPWGRLGAGAGEIGEMLASQFIGEQEATGEELSAQLGAFERYVAAELASHLKAQHFLAAYRFYRQPPPPGSRDDYYYQAVLTDDDETALSLVETALEKDPDYYPARHLRAVLMLRQLRFAEMLEEARGLATDLGQTHRLLGAGLLMMGRPEQARAEVQLAVERVGEDAWLHLLRGLCYAREGNLGLAMRAYNQALELDPDGVAARVARFARGRAHAYMGSHEAALADAKKVVELLPDSAEAYAFRGECYDKLGQYEQAIEDYATALSLGGDRLTLYGKQTLAAWNAEHRQVEGRAAAAGQTPGQDDTAPTSPPDAGQGLSPLDQFLQELTRDQKPSRGANRSNDVSPST